MGKLYSERQGHLVSLPAEAPMFQAEIVCPVSCKINELWQLKAPVWHFCSSYHTVILLLSLSFFCFSLKLNGNCTGRTSRVSVLSRDSSKCGLFWAGQLHSLWFCCLQLSLGPWEPHKSSHSTLHFLGYTCQCSAPFLAWSEWANYWQLSRELLIQKKSHSTLHFLRSSHLPCVKTIKWTVVKRI